MSSPRILTPRGHLSRRRLAAVRRPSRPLPNLRRRIGLATSPRRIDSRFSHAFGFDTNDFSVRLARADAERDAVLRLRFEVFNLELGEGLAESYGSGRDEDAFDAQCDHLLIEERSTGQVVGTYRLQTLEQARAGLGFYTLGGIPSEPRRRTA